MIIIMIIMIIMTIMIIIIIIIIFIISLLSKQLLLIAGCVFYVRPSFQLNTKKCFDTTN